MGIDQLVTGGDVDDPIVDSLNTDDATVNDSFTYGSHDIGAILEVESSGIRVETGNASHNDPGSASDGTWNTRETDTTDVTFSTAFSSVPDVYVTGSDGGGAGTHSRFNVSTTGFTATWSVYASNNSGDPDTQWLAIGDS